MDPADREVREESDRKGDEAEKWQARSNHGDQRAPRGWEEGSALNKTAIGVEGGAPNKAGCRDGSAPRGHECTHLK